MSNKQFRNVVRLIHLIIGGAMVAFIYSPLRLNSSFAMIMQFLVIPIAVASGIVMWQQPLVLKLLKRGKNG